jgi:hypothetical protein
VVRPDKWFPFVGIIVRRHLTHEGIAMLAANGSPTLANILELAKRDAKENGAVVDWGGVLDPYAGCSGEAAINARAQDLLARDLLTAQAEPSSKANFLVDFFGEAQVMIWDAFATGALPVGEEIRYRRWCETALLTYAAPCPIPTAERVLALMRGGRLPVFNGVTGVKIAERDTCQIDHDHGFSKARCLINVTGSVDRRVESPNQPALVRRLRERGLLRPYVKDSREMNGAAVDMRTFRAHGSRNIYIANMFLWGPGFFTSSAFMMATVVDRLLTAAFAPQTRPAFDRMNAISGG